MLLHTHVMTVERYHAIKAISQDILIAETVILFPNITYVHTKVDGQSIHMSFQHINRQHNIKLKHTFIMNTNGSGFQPFFNFFKLFHKSFFHTIFITHIFLFLEHRIFQAGTYKNLISTELFFIVNILHKNDKTMISMFNISLTCN